MKNIKLFTAVTFFISLFMPIKGYSQTFQPFSFERYMAPVQAYSNAYNRAVDKFDRYIEAFYDAIEREDYERGLYYLQRCKELNDRFDGNLCNTKELNKLITACEEAVKEQKKQRQQGRNY